MFPNCVDLWEDRNIHISEGLNASLCGRKRQPWCIAAAQTPVNTAQSGAHEMPTSKMKNLLSQDKGSVVSCRYACGFLLERQFLKEGAVTHCSASVLWRGGGLAGPGLGGGAQRTAGQADWVSLSRTGDVGSEGKGEEDCSAKEAFSYRLSGPVSSLHLPYFCLSEVLRATFRRTWLSIWRWGREELTRQDIAMHSPNSLMFL